MEKTLAGERTMKDSAIEFETPGLETDANEMYVESWGDEQRMLVSLNQDVIVVCPWMDNAEVTLGTAMNTYEYPPNLTAEDEPFLISVVNELLASRVSDDKELEDLVLEVEEEPTADKNETELREDEGEQPEESDRRVIDDEVSKAKVGPVTTKKQHLEQHVAEVHQLEKPLVDTKESSQLEAVVKIITSKPATDVLTEQTHSSEPVALEDESTAGRRAVETGQPADALEIIKVVAPEVTTIPEQTLVAELGRSQTRLDDEMPDLSAAQSLHVEPSAESDPTVRALEIERPTALAEGVAVLIDRAVGSSEDQPSPVNIRAHLGSDETKDPGEEDVMTGHLTIPVPGVIDDDSGVKEQPVAGKDDEPRLWAEMEVATIAPLAEVNVVAERILAECIERSNTQITEVDSHYLDKIIEVAAEVQVLDGGEDADEAKPTEELEELFTELFDEMGTPPTPELIERLVHRTIEQRVAKNKELKDEEIADNTRQSGLSTMLKKPSVGHVTLNDTIVHSRLISKIALELCGFKASFNLN